ncbi:MAG TPA: hypothetical protein PK640_20095 [Verrucomicrobiota bacterium]|nr:hypothetical protein [Verrucomicrobiota bacterium]
MTLGDSPFSDREHPFSFSGSAEQAPRHLEFTIKELGDFTRRIKNLKRGQRAYLDGPFGALSADRHPGAEGFVFIAGGIGITPMMSHLRTFADRGDRRPLVLIYGGEQPVAARFPFEAGARAAAGVVHPRRGASGPGRRRSVPFRGPNAGV